mgnify:CR=1 FL=1
MMRQNRMNEWLLLCPALFKRVSLSLTRTLAGNFLTFSRKLEGVGECCCCRKVEQTFGYIPTKKPGQQKFGDTLSLNGAPMEKIDSEIFAFFVV